MQLAITTIATATILFWIWHMWRRWSTPQKFLFGIYWWTWKTTIKKNYWKGQIKNVGISILTMLFKKNKERKTLGEINILDLCTKNVDDMITSSWNKEYSVRNSPRQSANAEAYLHFIVLIKMPRQLNS